VAKNAQKFVQNRSMHRGNKTPNNHARRSMYRCPKSNMQWQQNAINTACKRPYSVAKTPNKLMANAQVMQQDAEY
jgi:hypothetical protein